MGYTHYWKIRQGANEENLKKAVADMGRVIRDLEHDIPLCGGMGDAGTKPETTKDGVNFNGKEDDSHENFVFPEKWGSSFDPGWSFDFCKTAYKPYDMAVTACLTIAKHHMGDDIKVSSDGDEPDWEEGVRLASNIIGEEIPCPLEE